MSRVLIRQFVAIYKLQTSKLGIFSLDFHQRLGTHLRRAFNVKDDQKLVEAVQDVEFACINCGPLRMEGI